MLSADDGADMLLDYNPAGDRQDARRLSIALGGLPIAIRLAGLYLADTSQNPWPGDDSIDTVAAYQAAVHDGSIPDSQTRDTISNSLNLSLTLLDQKGFRFARPLLQLLSMFADAKIPFRAILDPDLLAGQPGYDGINGAELWRSVKALLDLGMVEAVSSESQISLSHLRVHPVVQRISRLAPRSIAPNLETATLLIRQAAARALNDAETATRWLSCQELTPHVKELIAVAKSAECNDATISNMVAASCAVSSSLMSSGFHREAERVCRLSNNLVVSKFGPKHKTTLHSYHDLARALAKSEKYAEAEEAWFEVRRITSEEWGTDSPKDLETRHEYADYLVERGQAQKAIHLLRTILAKEAAIRGERSKRVLTTKNCLGDALRIAGKAEEAVQVLTDVLAARTAVVGYEDADTMETRHDLAHALDQLGQLDVAERLHRELLDQHLKDYGANAGSTLGLRHCLSHLQTAKGNVDEAVAELRIALDGRIQTLGESHPATLEWRRCFASLLGRQQGGAAAERQELEAVLGLFSSSLGDEHSATLRTRHALAHALSVSGDHIGAQKQFSSVLGVQRRVLGASHVDTQETKLCLAAEKRKASQTRGAFPLHGGGKSANRKKRDKR